MPTITEKRIEYPIKEIFTNIADVRGITLRHFTQEYFLPESQKAQFPVLADLSTHLIYSSGVEIAKDSMVAFEGSNDDISLAYFSRKNREYSNINKEFGLIYSNGRRIHLILNENGNGEIEVKDMKVREARYKLRKDSFGGSFDKFPEASFGFRQRVRGDRLPGVRDFLETMLE